jgi:hypothetical protein
VNKLTRIWFELLLQVIDQKTTQEIGYFVYNLISLVDKPDLQVDSQPYRLTKSGPDSKIDLSFKMRVSSVIHKFNSGIHVLLNSFC